MKPETTFPYQDVRLSIEKRVADLVSRMTLAEKVSQMLFDAPAIERLDVAKHNWWNECLHGVGRSGVATVFPQAIGLAATWNPNLIHRMAIATSNEARAKHHATARRSIREIYTGLTFWTPNVNIFRDPRWGRGQETYGEDPYLTACMGVAFVKGIQGDDPKYLKLAATPKHYAVHSGPEPERHHFDAQVSEREMREFYLPAFEACVKEARAVSIMGAYTRANGEPCCASPTLLEKILRREWGFDGYVVSDCWAIIDIYQHHRVVKTPEEAAALAVKAGCDLNCGSTYPALLDAVDQGLIDEATIDQAVKRLFTARFRLGMFDPPEQVPYAQIPFEVIDSPEHRALALQTTRESIVLLKNENQTLPLPKNLKSMAVIGPNADSLPALLGNYNGTPAKGVTPLEGIRQKISANTTLYYAQGCEIAEGVPPLRIIPPTYLRPADAEAGVMGLTAAYYDNPGFKGKPVQIQVDPVVNFIWKGTTPLTGQWADHFAVRWTGYLAPPVSGRYQLGVNGFSSYRLYLDDRLLVEYKDIHHPVLKAQDVELEAGRFYRIQLDYVSAGLDPQVKLFWAMPQVDYKTQALEVAQKAEVVVMVMGLSPNLEGEEMPVHVQGFAGGDRTDIALPRPQEELLKQIHALGKPVVLILLNGSALAVNWAAQNIPAIVEAWYPGQAGGEALADVLFGDYNPAGRLPVTFYKSINDLPPFENYHLEGHTYRYFRGEPLFAFGHGLSYTTFKYSNLKLSAKTIRPDEPISISLQITNTGERAGDEVVQLYVQDVEASVPRPLKELKGFQRLSLEPGEKKTIVFTLSPGQLAFYNDELKLIIEPGLLKVLIGSSSEDIRLVGEFNIAGEMIEIAQKTFFSTVETK
ncbi:MAG: glycoside hydrolase family 3 C-terminal domain-containing protein [Anaerolineae bacterium]|nr:glycoside hydrolase family 3 C-terminal domain-containing protein [Anaerolineae bacterium]